MAKDPVTRSCSVQGQEKMDIPTQDKRENLPFSAFLFPQQIGDASPARRECQYRKSLMTAVMADAYGWILDHQRRGASLSPQGQGSKEVLPKQGAYIR